MAIKSQIRRGTASQWSAANTVLANGEWGLETDTKKLKIGDGITPWSSLAYVTDATYANAVSFAANASNITNGTLSADRLAVSGVVDGTYGNSSAIPVVTVDSKGRITNATTTAVAGVTGYTYQPSNSTFTITTGDGSTYAANVTAGNSSTQGLLRIVDSVSNTSVAVAASANSVKTAYDTAIAAGANATSAYANAIAFANTVANNAYTNAVSFANTAANSAYANAVAFANTAANAAYANAVLYTDAAANSAYTNAISFANAAANNAYVNAVSYANSAATAAYSNAATFANTVAAAAYSNAISFANIVANAAYTNATVFASNASNINTGTLAEARLPYRMSQNVASNSSVEFVNVYLTGNLTVGSNVNVIGANNYSVTDNMIYLNANATYANPDIGFTAGYNDGTYAHTGFFRDHTTGIWKVFDGYLPEPDASIYIDQSNSSFRTSGFMANVVYVGNNTVYGTVNSTAFSGTANNATNFGGLSLTTVQGQITGNAATAYSNAVNYVSNGVVNGAIVVANAVYASNSGLLGGSSLTTIQGQITGNAATAYSNSVAYTNITANAITNSVSNGTLVAFTANNSNNLGGVPAASYVNTSGSYTITGVHTYNANLVVNAAMTTGNTVINGTVNIVAPNTSAAAWTTSGIGLVQAPTTWTDTSSTGTVADVRVNYFAPQTVAANNTITISNLYGAYFANPVAGANVSITSRWALGADAANIGGSFSAGSGQFNVGSTGILTYFGPTSTHTVGFAISNTTSGNTKTVNIGTGGLAGSTTNITLGSNVSGANSNVNVNGTTFVNGVFTVANSTSNVAVFAANGNVGIGGAAYNYINAYTTATTSIVLDTFNASTYSTVDYVIQAFANSNYQTSTLRVVANSTVVFSTEIGRVFTGASSIAEYTTTISGGVVSVNTIPVISGTTFKIIKTMIGA